MLKKKKFDRQLLVLDFESQGLRKIKGKRFLVVGAARVPLSIINFYNNF